MRTPIQLDPATMSDAELAEIYAMRVAAKLELAPDEPARTVSELIARTRNHPEMERTYEYVLEGGYARLVRYAGKTNCEVEVVVDPRFRRRGLGTRLLACLVAKAREIGCTMMSGPFAGEGGAAFAASAGARADNGWIISTLALPTVVEPVPVPGYSVRSWQSAVPDELVESFARAANAINDAPHAEGAEPWQFTPDLVRDIEASLRDRGIQLRTTVALDENGEVVGSTDISVGPEPGAVARTRNTVVVAAHRRAGLARWMKVESLVALMADRPDARLLVTSNNPTNTGMLAVNRAVGFKAVSTWTNAVLDL